MGKVIKWCLGICAALVVALIVLVCVYLGKEWNRTTYFKNTTIDGYDVSEMTPDEVVPILKNAFTAASVMYLSSPGPIPTANILPIFYQLQSGP